jgi:hypothetical protein
MRAHPFLPAIVLGATVAFLAAYMSALGIQKADSPKIISPIVQMEFARSADDIFLIVGKFGDPNLHTEIMEDFRQSIALDTYFIIAYTVFLAVTIALIWRRLHVRKWVLCGIPLAISACVFDFLENDRLLQILNLLDTSFETPLRQLQIFTHVKWGSLAAVFFILAPVTLRTGWWGRFLSVLALIGFVFALIVWALPYTPIQLAYSFVLALLFLWLFVWVILQHNKH